jgi:serine-type D-Ala-D-Ala carboxypeptidase (penicillin-binding protein 5/6)
MSNVSGGPPPVPGGPPSGDARHRASGRRSGTAPQRAFGRRSARRSRAARRSRPARLAAAVVVVLAPLAVGAAAYLSFGDGNRSAAAPAPAVVLRSPPARPAPEEQPERAQLVQAATVPDVRLAGIDAFHVRLRRPLRRLPIASLTKVMTALLAVEGGRPREAVRITGAALRYSGSGVGLLPRGRRVRFETLLNGLLIVSGNDAAIALAVHLAHTERRFVRRMNLRARRWGLGCTRFVSSHGLESGNRSCARDLAVLTRLAMTERRIRRIARRREASFRFPIKGKRLFLTGHNPLHRIGYRGAIGLKTGYTFDAGRCFIGVARRGGRTLGVVLLNSRDPSRHAPKLLDAAFAST